MYLPILAASPLKQLYLQFKPKYLWPLLTSLSVMTSVFSFTASAEITLPPSLITPSVEQASSTEPVTQYLNGMLQLLKPAYSQLGISVWDMTTQQTVFTYNNQSLIQPASIQKLLTALAATKQLGRGFTYQTHLSTFANAPLTKQQVINGVYHGDIYIEFSGDPTLTYQDLLQLLTSLRHS